MTTRAPRSHASESYSFIDIMTAALAEVEEPRFYADTDRWNEAWKKIVDSGVGQGLLADVTFTSRAPYSPFSEQVEILIRTLSRASVISLGNPRYMFFTMDARARRDILDRNKDIVERFSTQLDGMRKILTETLSVKEEDLPADIR